MIEAVCNEMKLGRQRAGWKELDVRQAEKTGDDGSGSFLAVQAAEQQTKKIENQTCIF